MKKTYFKENKNHPPPLSYTTRRTVRFEEVDPIGLVWHGRYPSYFEDARVRLGEQYGIGYPDFYKQGVLAPIKQIHIDYHKPLRFGDKISIEARLHWSEAVRINFEFVIKNAENKIATTGYSIQLMLDREENVLVVQPPFYRIFRERWRTGEFA